MAEVIQCGACHCPLSTIQKCAKCLSAFYCGRDCQMKDWKNHKLVCGKEKTPIAKLELVIPRIRADLQLVYELLNLLIEKNEAMLVVIKCLYDEETDQFELMDPEVMTPGKYSMMTEVEVEPETMKLQIILTDMALDFIGCCTVPFTEITRSKDDPRDVEYQPVFPNPTDDSSTSEEASSSDSSVIESDHDD